jgi:serine phosphatase RsbU (regulator of sigma subunit)
MILGVVKEQRIETVDVRMPPGTTVVAYTDGLVERRSRGIDVGIERLRATVRPDRPEVVCQDVMEALVGRDIPRDDIAVVAFRRSPA